MHSFFVSLLFLFSGHFLPSEGLPKTNATIDSDEEFADDAMYALPQLPNYPILRKASPTSQYYFPGIEDELQVQYILVHLFGK